MSEKFSTAVLLKGGHLFAESCPDFLCSQGEIFCFDSPRLATEASHGTGCTLSAAITARLAHGDDLVDACACAKEFIGQALSQALQWTHNDQAPIHMLNQGTTHHNNSL